MSLEGAILCLGINPTNVIHDVCKAEQEGCSPAWGHLSCPVVEMGLTNDRAPIQQSATLPQAQRGRLCFLSYKLTCTALLSFFF